MFQYEGKPRKDRATYDQNAGRDGGPVGQRPPARVARPAFPARLLNRRRHHDCPWGRSGCEAATEPHPEDGGHGGGDPGRGQGGEAGNTHPHPDEDDPRARVRLRPLPRGEADRPGQKAGLEGRRRAEEDSRAGASP